MRLLSTLALAIGLPAVALAQGNSSTTTQTGAGHVGYVTQSGGATSIMTQGLTAASLRNRAVVEQVGASTTFVTQTGIDGMADVAQLGAANTATIDQAGVLNVGLVYQGRMGVYLDPWADTQDDGTSSGNTATVRQTGSNNSGLDLNELSLFDGGLIYQGTRGGISTGNTAIVTQSGDHGQAWASQGDDHATGMGNTSTITQAGQDNDASTVQGYYLGSSATGSTATIDQLTGSSASMAIVFQGVNGTSGGDVTTVTQSGARNQARIYQGVGDPDFVLTASGISSGNQVTVLQEAMDNVATVNQGVGDGVSSVNSFAFVYQYSAGNVATITQAGSTNTATVTQQ